MGAPVLAVWYFTTLNLSSSGLPLSEKTLASSAHLLRKDVHREDTTLVDHVVRSRPLVGTKEQQHRFEGNRRDSVGRHATDAAVVHRGHDRNTGGEVPHDAAILVYADVLVTLRHG